MNNNNDDHYEEQIDITDQQQVARWMLALNITKVQLKAAINAAGKSSLAITNYLKKKKQK